MGNNNGKNLIPTEIPEKKDAPAPKADTKFSDEDRELYGTPENKLFVEMLLEESKAWDAPDAEAHDWEAVTDDAAYDKLMLCEEDGLYDEREPAEKSDRAVKPGGFSGALYEWVQCVVSTVLATILFFVFVGRQIGVIGDSMRLTLHDSDRVFISNLFYEPEYGDIVIIKTDEFGNVPIVKRVIATAGQVIDIDFENHIVTVDGVAIDEPYIAEPTASRLDFQGPVTIPEGCVFVMGDNRNDSTDSRSKRVGFVDTRNILGKVLIVLWPGHENGEGMDWSRMLRSPYKI
ncbi:MAG: signal peptidase I [Oscillospiraceae bacterium]|nr:signal peptidase I [Oscillospiraceae bacterium]